MKPPTCKLCGERHWLDEGHKAGLEAVRELGAAVLRNTAVKRTVVPTFVPTPPDVPTEMSLQEPVVPTDAACECGKPREGRYKKCPACR